MTRTEFAIKTKLLEDYYAKKMNSAQAQFWYDELGWCDVEKYEKAIKHLCMTSRYMPLLGDVIECIKTIRNANSEEKNKEKCELCKGTGYILYNKVENSRTYQYACLCVCKNAEGLEYNGMTIADKEHRQPYCIKSSQEIFGDKLQKTKTELQSSVMPQNVNKLINDLGKQLSL